MAKSAIVVGAGPAGALLAYLLVRKGVGVTLLERQVDFEREFRGEVLMPSGIDALTQAGLGKRLREIPTAKAVSVGLYVGPRLKVFINLERLPSPPMIVPQPSLLEMLVAQAARFEGFHLERGATVRDLIVENGRVTGVGADTASGQRAFRADFIVACDGRASVVRKRLHPTVDTAAQFFDVVWAKLPLDGYQPEPRLRAYVMPGHLLIAYPSPLGHLQIGWVIEKGRFGDVKKLGESWIDQLAPYITSDLAEFLRAGRHSASRPFLLDVVCDRVTDWTAPGVLLIGDASHPMSPVGGQGINVALRDAVVAANHLIPALTGVPGTGNEIDNAARLVQAERSSEVVQIQQMQQIGPRLIFSRGLKNRLVLSDTFIWLARTVLAPLITRRFRPFLYGTTRVELHNGEPHS